MKNYKYLKNNLLLFVLFSIFLILNYPSVSVMAETSESVEWIKNNWLNYPSDIGKWTTNTINGNPALGSTQNVNWSGYLNTFAMDTTDSVFEFKMYQNELNDDDNMGWTFRHNYINSPTSYANHSFYVFVTNGGNKNNGNIPSGLYKKSYGTNIAWNPNHGMKLLQSFDFSRLQKTLYNVKIEVKDETGGTRIKAWIDGNEVLNYLDTDPIPSGGYGPFSFSQANAYYYDMNINGSSVYNIPPTLTVTSPAENTSFNPGSSINLVGSANDADNRGTLSTYYQIDDGTQQLIWTNNQTGSPISINENITISNDIGYGNHTLTVWAKDSENAESKKTVINFFVNDITKPTATHSITTETDGTKTIKIVAKDTGSGVKRIILPNGNIVNSDSTTYNVANENNDYSFKIEDNVGNFINYVVTVSDVKISPVLEATPNNKEDYINLKWSMSDTWQEYIYNVFKKETTQSEYQSIPAKSTAKVLNIYPEVSETITFTTYDGETLTLPKSASLKMWMESPNSENSKGYGMGLIEVDAVSIADFNENPYYYLKDSNGNWKYDSVYQGAWDSNGHQSLSDSAKEAIIELIKSKRGFLTGHDTETEYLREYLNFDSVRTDTMYTSTQLVINKKGFLTNYPWNIGDVGTILNIPMAHSQPYQHPLGDVWLQFYDSTWGASDYSEYNFYLTTWNNVAMIQTGHSNGEATSDEQKILANTIFYLSQLTTDTELDDRTGQDITPPTNPKITRVVANGKNSTITVNFTPSIEQGTTYDYYVQAIGKKNNSKTNSNIESATITSGFKGYSIVIDNSPNTIPDNIIETTNTTYQLSKEITSQFYVHICAIDNVGNKSEVQHYLYSDSFSPSMTLTPNTINWTNKDVTIVVNANDNETGVKRIKLPNGNYVNGATATFAVSTNGTYEFIAEDYVGNTFTKSIVVQNIDKETPTISYTKEFNTDKTSGYINLSIKDTLSGFSKLELPKGEVITTSTYKYPINNNGMYLFTAWDKANNKSILGVTVNELNTNNTASGISKIEYKLSGATIKDWTTYTEAFYITNEGITTITARSYDKAGNVSEEVSSQVKIDKTKPINNGIRIELK